ncbi:hypothetical protein U8C32_09155 [Sinorhizobium medicae]|nr:hypothetical protein [Sinorhizobium medicae]WQO47035.1 hypothetical protein U8C42_08990 [Sinorhizobium medicae]WQO63788.1 hypothetical protein U8C40_11285 [Sinorhizobium medicae]WQO74401.1 hypothetical protein U8C31_09150 [Sinorhizobium medicae]WQO93707.1 hypothetical protein U8C32_09155 [Sinorhizobium medicae]
MARETLPVALELMFGDEGGYSNHKGDRGNWLPAFWSARSTV